MMPCTLAGLSEQALTAASPRVHTTRFADAQGGPYLEDHGNAGRA